MQYDASSEPGELEQARAWLMQEGLVATPRVLAVLARAPGIESNEPAQAVLADVIAVLLDGCERGELASVVSVFADCPPDLARMALALLTAAFFPDGKIVPQEFDDSAVLCFALFVSVAGQPLEAMGLLEQTRQERTGERFTANAALLRAHIDSMMPQIKPSWHPDSPTQPELEASPRALIYMTARNCEGYVGDSLRSLANQTHANLHVLFIDDASDDATGTIASGILAELFPASHTFIRNDRQWGKARNAHVHLRSHATDATFVGILDGDDQLIDPGILARIAGQYAQGTDVVWTNYMTDQGVPGHCGPLDPDRPPRDQAWKSSHFFTFRAELLANVDEGYFKDDDGEWFMSACDWAIAYPILDQTRRYRYIPKIAYRYTTGNPESHHNSDPASPPSEGKYTSELQKRNAHQVLGKPALPLRRDPPQVERVEAMPMDARAPATDPDDLRHPRMQLTEHGIGAVPQVLEALAQTPGIESSESAQALLTDVIAMLLDECERGELASAISALAPCSPALAKIALGLLTAAFFPDGRITPAEFDDSAVLCFSLFVALAGLPHEALELVELSAQERDNPQFAANAALLRKFVAGLESIGIGDFSGVFINLDRSVDRRLAMEDALARSGLADVVRRLPASTGDCRPSGISPNELGCLLSHQRAITAADPARHLLVLEDDVWFPPQFQRYFRILHGLMASDDSDVVFLNMTVDFPNASRVQRLIRAKRRLGDIHAPTYSQFGLNDAKGLYDFGMMAYVVRRGAQAKVAAILDDAACSGYTQPVDRVLGAAIASGRIKASVLFPYIVGIDQGLSAAITDRRKRHLLFNDIVNLFVAGADIQALVARAVGGTHSEPFDVDAYVQSQLIYRWLAND